MKGTTILGWPVENTTTNDTHSALLSTGLARSCITTKSEQYHRTSSSLEATKHPPLRLPPLSYSLSFELYIPTNQNNNRKSLDPRLALGRFRLSQHNNRSTFAVVVYLWRLTPNHPQSNKPWPWYRRLRISQYLSPSLALRNARNTD